MCLKKEILGQLAIPKSATHERLSERTGGLECIMISVSRKKTVLNRTGLQSGV